MRIVVYYWNIHNFKKIDKDLDIQLTINSNYSHKAKKYLFIIVISKNFFFQGFDLFTIKIMLFSEIEHNRL